MPSDQFAEYDANIGALSRRLRMTREHGRTWKPHQYLALLFTEHYLRRYFDDPEALCADLNQAKSHYRPTFDLPDYTPDDLRTLAFQSATGSGKTLLMHAHVLQYRHYLGRAGGRLNNVVLVTPNEQMSVQHERELRESGLHARLFSSDAGSDLFAPVEIIDLNKLAERKGVKRVAVQDFGDDNLGAGWTKDTWGPPARSGASAARNSPGAASRSSTPPPSTRSWAGRTRTC